MPYNVRTHTRKTGSGGTTQVRQHQRTGGLGPNPQHAWKLAKKGVGHGKRGRKGMASALLTGALLEVVLWLAGQTIGMACAAAGAILIGIAVVLIRRKEGWH